MENGPGIGNVRPVAATTHCGPGASLEHAIEPGIECCEEVLECRPCRVIQCARLRGHHAAPANVVMGDNFGEKLVICVDLVDK